MALEYFVIDIAELWSEGVISLLYQRALIPLFYRFVFAFSFISLSFILYIVSIRYYPLFAALQQSNRLIRGSSCLYILANIGYVLIRRSSCIDYLPVSKRFTLYNEARHRLVCLKSA